MPTTGKPTPSWRDVLPVHPAADLFPLMTANELRKLGEDLHKNGLRTAVAVFKEQKHFPPALLDGRNRLDAIEAAGIAINIESLRHRRRSSYPVFVSSFSDRHDRDLRGPTSRRSLCLCRQRKHPPPPSHRRAEARVARQGAEGRHRKNPIGRSPKTAKTDHKTVASVRAEQGGYVGKFPTSLPGPTARAASSRRVNQASVNPGKKLPRMRPVGCWAAWRGPVTPCSAISFSTCREILAHRDDIGTASNGEIARKDARIEELEHENRRLQLENIALRSEIEELKAQLLDIPGFLDRTKEAAS